MPLSERTEAADLIYVTMENKHSVSEISNISVPTTTGTIAK